MDGDLDMFKMRQQSCTCKRFRAIPNSGMWEADKMGILADYFKGGGDHLFRNDNGHLPMLPGRPVFVWHVDEVLA